MGINAQESLAQSDETGNVQNPVGGQVVQLETIGVQQATNKRVQWKSKLAGEESLEAYTLLWGRGRDPFIPRQARFTLHHHAVSNQCIQIYGIKSRLLPATRHLGRLHSR